VVVHTDERGITVEHLLGAHDDRATQRQHPEAKQRDDEGGDEEVRREALRVEHLLQVVASSSDCGSWLPVLVAAAPEASRRRWSPAPVRRRRLRKSASAIPARTKAPSCGQGTVQRLMAVVVGA